MPGWAKAGTLYFASVFAIAFALGTVRVLFVIPRVGELAAVCLELPVVLAVAWNVCRLIRRRTGHANPVAIGALAFALLMVAEFGMAVVLFGQTAGEHLARYRTFPAQVGLVGQMAFGCIPWVQAKAGLPRG